MPYTAERKGTLLIPSGPGETSHLFGIVTDRCAAGEHLLLSITSVRQGIRHDPTCIVSAGEHPFILHDSYVAYRLAVVQSGERLARMVEGWVYKPKEDLSEELCERMLEGVARSDFTPRRIIDDLAK